MILALGAAAGLVLAAVLGYLFVLKGTRAIALAVLPFKDLTLEQNQGLLSEGLADEIRDKLSENEKLQVIFKDSSDKYRTSPKSLGEFGRDLHVRKIVSGELRTDSDTIVVKVELIDVATGVISLSSPFKGSRDNYKRIEGQIVEAIVDKLRIQPSSRRWASAKGLETSNLEAWTEYRGGLRSFMSYRDDPTSERDFLDAVAGFKKAAALDPEYFSPNSGLGDAYEARFVVTHDPSDQISMETYYQQAYDINPSLPESNVGMGWIFFHRVNHEKAYEYFRRAVELDPNNPSVMFGAGSFLRSMGLFDKALEHYQRAIKRDPRSYLVHLTAASCYTYLGELKTALALAQQAVGIEPTLLRTHLYYARQLLLVNRCDEAENELTRAAEIKPDDRMLFRLKVWLAALRGQRGIALERLRTLTGPLELSRYEITNTYGILGLADEAIQNIRAGIDKSFEISREYIYTYLYLIHNPYFKGLKNNPRFKEILTAEKLKYEENMRKFGRL